jgi:hypothetical protein
MNDEGDEMTTNREETMRIVCGCGSQVLPETVQEWIE